MLHAKSHSQADPTRAKRSSCQLWILNGGWRPVTERPLPLPAVPTYDYCALVVSNGPAQL